MTRIAIIPARCGSKRIKQKNLSLIEGKPAILLAIEIAKRSGLFSEIVVSTDCQQISTLAVESGVLTMGIRPRDLANDFATTLEVVQYEISNIRKRGLPVKEVCCIYPVTPLLKSQRLVEAYNLLIRKSLLFVVPVQESYLNEERRLNVDENFIVSKQININRRTQDLKKSYFDAGQFYWGTISAWENSSSIFTDQTGVIVFDKWETIDVDDPNDLELVRVLYRNRKGGE